MARFISVVLLAVGVSASAIADPPRFSFWRNLSRSEPSCREIEYSEQPMELAPDVIENCCSLKLAQPVTLIRDGVLEASGRIQSVHAVMEASAGDSRRIYFEVEELQGPIGASGPPPFPKFVQANYDLYIIGDVHAEVLAPQIQAWDPASSLVAIADEALASGCLDELSFRSSPSFSSNPSELLDSASVAAVLAEEAEFVKHKFGDPEALSIEITSMRRGERYSEHGFVRVSGGSMSESVYLRGLLDYFVRIDGDTYAILRDSKAGCGLWGYFVYRINLDGPPERVYAETSWST